MALVLQIAFYLVALVIVLRILRWITTPIFRITGVYRYYSRMFFTFSFSKNDYDLHVGTSWDFFRLENRNQLTIFKFMAEGLINICTEIEKGNIDINSKFKGNTYFFKDNTAHKLGFNTRELTFSEAILFLLNYPEVCLLQSLMLKRLTLPKLDSVRIHYISGRELLQNKHIFQRYLDGFNRRLGKTPEKVEENSLIESKVA